VGESTGTQRRLYECVEWAMDGHSQRPIVFLDIRNAHCTD
jgi:hypothetical protein